ncbi:glycosyltransferase family 4 protein [Mongoliibacter ruber]|uniref:Glycosyltransferase involved in cell wall biosynthesis n=1 Tax=Mongoliibacter ruber TaxID=1750599 RepID=A0A2T0WNY2_9BACT|nr:glycosyltransferase family 4 protein [Mongoliibacter ruber]PRY88395.1 glycosyltransferase involved in cell wall biosynthesis [Mongoliibacter ruber]
MKKIVFLHTDFRIYWPARINNLFSYLTSLGFDLQVIEISGLGSNYHFAKNPKQADFWECLFPDKSLQDLDPTEIRKAVLKRLEEIKPHVLITGAIAFPSGATGVYYANKNQIPLIVFDDAKLEDVKRNLFVNWVKKQLYSGVDAIFCPALGWESTFNFFGFGQERLFYGVDVVDNDFFMNNKDVSENSPVISKNYFLNVGRQVEKKNLLMLLTAYHQLTQKNENVPDLVLVGDGPKRQELEGYIKKHQMKNVQLLPFFPQDTIREIYKNAKAFVLPSSFGETWGLVINEAMASGLPVIVSNKVGCAGTLVQNEVNGFVFDVASKDSLVKAMQHFIMLNEDQTREMSDSSRNIIKDWGLDRFNEGMISAITFVTQTPKRKISFSGKLIANFWLGRYNAL